MALAPKPLRFPGSAWALALALALPARSPAAPAIGNPADEGRIDALLAQMTLDEKVGQVTQFASDTLTGPGQVVKGAHELVRAGRVGSLFNAVTATETNALQMEAVKGSRLHIPLLFGFDVIHGFRTEFPIPLGLSASWDPDLVVATSRLAAREASAQGVRWVFSPMVDIARDPRWGRITEGAGEDPYLGSAFARAYVRGYQGDRLDDPASVVACAKHYVGYGAVEGGRDYNSTEISERTLREVYLPPFHAAVDAGVGTIMAAFNAVDGVPSTANAFTLTRVLRDEWQFHGFVDSDWTAVRELILHGIAEDEPTAGRKAFLAGVDVDMQSSIYFAHLADLVRSGQVPMERLDRAVRGVLRVKFALGLFERPYVPAPLPGPAIPADGAALAVRAAEESFVLLQNRAVHGQPVLPLAAATGLRIALLGPLADSAADMLGSWGGASHPEDVVTLKAALAARAKRAGLKLRVVTGTDIPGSSEAGFAAAVAAARQSDVAILALGETSHSSGEASVRSALDLPGNQEKFLEAVVATGKPVVLLVFSGRPLGLPWAAAHVPAIIEAWFPGIEAGPALDHILFGETSPAGRLSVSVPRSVGQVPIYYNHLNTGRPRVDPQVPGTNADNSYYVTGYLDLEDGPLYPFGHGLTYTTFAYDPVKVDAAALSAAALNAGAAQLTVTAQIRNTGLRPGTEVAQLYIRLRGTSVARPIRELKGFQRVLLQPGESRTLTFTLGRDELAFWNLDMKHVVEPSTLYVWVAPDSAQGSPTKVTIGD